MSEIKLNEILRIKDLRNIKIIFNLIKYNLSHYQYF